MPSDCGVEGFFRSCKLALGDALGLGRLGRLIFGVALGALFRSNGSSTLALCGRVLLAVAVSGRDEITLEALEGTADEIPWYSRLSHVSG
mmetsp:Transcript_27106/g.59156  ORF Transcript_27106/g.59156 Transcript_27106/m.59156 type:complete len:90 (+) Transcript_27106:267-536(+)